MQRGTLAGTAGALALSPPSESGARADPCPELSTTDSAEHDSAARTPCNQTNPYAKRVPSKPAGRRSPAVGRSIPSPLRVGPYVEPAEAALEAARRLGVGAREAAVVDTGTHVLVRVQPGPVAARVTGDGILARFAGDLDA